MLDAKENREKEMAARNPGGEDFVRLIFFLAVFLRVTHDGRGTTRCFYIDYRLDPLYSLFSFLTRVRT